MIRRSVRFAMNHGDLRFRICTPMLPIGENHCRPVLHIRVVARDRNLLRVDSTAPCGHRDPSIRQSSRHSPIMLCSTDMNGRPGPTAQGVFSYRLGVDWVGRHSATTASANYAGHKRGLAWRCCGPMSTSSPTVCIAGADTTLTQAVEHSARIDREVLPDPCQRPAETVELNRLV